MSDRIRAVGRLRDDWIRPEPARGNKQPFNDMWDHYIALILYRIQRLGAAYT